MSKSKVARSSGVSLNPENFLLMGLGCLLVGLGFLQAGQFKWLGNPFPGLEPHQNFLLVAGAVLWGIGLRFTPSPGASPWPRWAVYPLLALVLGSAAFLRLYRGDQAFGFYWDDPAICIIDPRNIVDLHVFRLTFAIGLREPMYPYAAAGVWALHPSMDPILAQRLTSALFDLAAVFVFYRLGTEVSGKRQVGLLLAALAAVSKPMVMQNLCGMPGLLLPFVVGLSLLFQVRLFKKPTLAHFLQWGFAIAFGAYSYIAYRPWILFLILVTLAWLFYLGRFKGVRWPVAALLGLFSMGFFAFHLDKMFFILHDNALARFWGGSAGGWIVLQALFLGGFLYFRRSSKGHERDLLDWGLGLLLAGVLLYPLAVDPSIALKIRDISTIPKNPLQWLSGDFIRKTYQQFEVAVRAIFLTGDDRPDMNVVGDPFLEYHAAVLAILGLTFAVARLSWTNLLLVLGAFVGIVGRVFTGDPQSAKLLGALPCLLLLGAMAMEHFIGALWSARGRVRWSAWLVAAGLAVFVVWDGRGTFLRVYEKWWYVLCPDVRVSQEVSRVLPQDRVYLTEYHGLGFLSPAVQGVLHDGDPLYLLKPENPIDVEAGTPRQDVAVIFFYRDKDLYDRIKKEFPKAQWTPCWQYYQDPKVDQPFMYRVLIPAAQVPERPGKLFHFNVVQGDRWLRRIYVTYYGLARGMIQTEDMSPSLNPLTSEAGAHSISAEGTWEAPEDGRYTFTTKSGDIAQVWVDGRPVLCSWGDLTTQSRTLEFKKGPHHVRYAVYLKVYLRFADVTIRDPEIHYEMNLGSR